MISYAIRPFPSLGADEIFGRADSSYSYRPLDKTIQIVLRIPYPLSRSMVQPPLSRENPCARREVFIRTSSDCHCSSDTILLHKRWAAPIDRERDTQPSLPLWKYNIPLRHSKEEIGVDHKGASSTSTTTFTLMVSHSCTRSCRNHSECLRLLSRIDYPKSTLSSAIGLILRILAGSWLE